MTKEQQEWFSKFQHGTLLVKGWQDRIKEILTGIPEPAKEEIRTVLSRLGNKIGGEWSKDNRIRKIDTAMIQKWGQELSSAKNCHAVLREKIRSIDAQVDKILS